jgi:RNA polymerase sigma factor (sigma-70 family)
MDDATLIKKLRNGEMAAIRFLVEKHQNLVWHIILNMTGKTEDLEDLFQEIFLQVFRGCKRFKAESKLSTWIGSIAHHVCVDYLRKKKRDLNIFNEFDNGSGDRSYTDWINYDKEDLNILIRNSIEKLPVPYRTVIVLYHLDDCSYKDISEITGMPEGTVKSYISRGRQMLRKILEQAVPDLVSILDK